MARIRSIKPDFGTDGKIARLPDSTALFFILLWCQCDDFGYFTLDTKELALKTGRWRSQGVQRMLRSLSERGLVRVSGGSGVGQVMGWDHQRIKDKRASKWNDSTIVWDEIENDAAGSSFFRPGEDRRGEERNPLRAAGAKLPPDSATAGAQSPEPEIQFGPSRQKGGKKKQENPNSDLNRRIWESYAAAYSKRWRKDPVRNAKVNSNVAQLALRLGEDAIGVVEFFVLHNDAFYVKKTHDIGLCLSDAETLHTQWVRGRAITGTDVKQFEKQQQNANLFAAIDRGEV